MPVLTRRQLEGVFFNVTCTCLGVDPDSVEAQPRVRISWPVDSQGGSNPGWDRDTDVCFLRIAPYRDPYTQLRERTYTNNNGLTTHVAYTRCHEVSFICYGPNAMEDADAIRNNIFEEAARDTLAENALYPIPHIDEPIRADELDGGMWWGRCDISVRFYEAASRETQATAFEEIPEIIIGRN